jgi:ribosomal protein S18 acetylase RimI-like enzyme
VAPEFRNHGLGRALVGSCLIDLRACGLAKVSILIYSHNDHGRAFWEHLNWHSRPDLELMQTGL